MLQTLQNKWKHEPLMIVLAAGLSIRLVAAFFSKGYAFHDDHFCVITVAQYWIYDVDYWFIDGKPPKHSIFYAGLHYFLFLFLENIGLGDPEAKMTVVRLIHAFYSLLAIFFAYKIAAWLSDTKTARKVGLMMALVWFMPMMSVKNLVEMVCIPPSLAGFYLLLKSHRSGSNKNRSFLLAGVLFGFAFVFRYHTVLFAGGLGAVLIFRKEWKGCALFSAGWLLPVAGIIGSIDVIFFDYPMHSVVEYLLYNKDNAYGYVTGPPEQYLFTIVGFLVPPVSLMLLFGYARFWEKAPMIFFAGLIFFLFHTAFPNKQERFILPLLPLIIILGTVGWQQFAEKSEFWQKRQGLLMGIWAFFWIVNVSAAIALSLTYSKKARIEPLRYLSQKEDVRAVLFITEEAVSKMAPVYYLGTCSFDYNHYRQFEHALPELQSQQEVHYPIAFSISRSHPLEEALQEMQALSKTPDYLVFKGRKNLPSRIEKMQSIYPDLVFEKEIQASLYDQLLHFLNPGIHPNEHVNIYRRSGQ